jgi:hypothetical protein
MENGIQEVIDQKKVIPEIKKRLDKQLKIQAELVKGEEVKSDI